MMSWWLRTAAGWVNIPPELLLPDVAPPAPPAPAAQQERELGGAPPVAAAQGVCSECRTH